MTEFRSDRENMLGVVERRLSGVVDEFRKDDATGQIILQGYAATFTPYDVHGGPAAGGWVEQLDLRAFDETLGEQPDVQLLINHTGTPLARTKSGTLKLSRDSHGLRVWASLDPSDPDVQALVPKMRRKDMDEMSFAFRVNDQTWDHSYSHRTINALSLEKGDVSVVNYGMNPSTKVVLADAVGALAQFSSQKELVELRKLTDNMDKNQLKRAAAALATITGYELPPGPGSIRPAGAAMRKDGDEPYGDVKYADPGYKTDGKKRYPLDSEGHVRSAWSYINMPKNQKGYTATQVSSIKGRIKSAASKFGIEISEGKSETGISRLDQVKRADGTMGLIAVMTDGARIPVPAQRALGAGEGWSPNNSDDNPADPHDVKYEVGPMGLVNPGPVPANIVGSGNQFAADQPSFVQPSPDDPHDESFDKEEQLSMDHHDDPYDFGPYPAGAKITPAHGDFAGEGGGDPHDTPYDLGGQVGKVPGDRPGGRAPQGQLPDNIVAGTGRGPGAGSGASPGTAPAVGTEPVVAPSGQAYDWSGGSLEPGDPQQELDAALRAMDAAVRAIDAIEAGCDPHDAPTLGGAGSSFHTGSWEPTNIEGGTLNKGAGEDGDSGERVELDLGMAEALEGTIIHCYKLAEGNAEVRQTLAVARKQFHALLRSKPQQKKGNAPAVPNEIQQKMDELRSEVGNPDTGNVAELIKYMRTEGTAPLGYRGLLDHDPDLHMTTAAERLAQEVLAKRERARVAASEYDKAEERVKAAQREAQLNDAIRRNNLNKAGR